MTWKKWALGACAALVLLMLSGMTALADTRVNLDELTKKRLAETEAINQACLKCHNQKPETAGRVPGQAPYVDPDHYRQSVHATIACTQCHEDVQPGNKPSVIVVEGNWRKRWTKAARNAMRTLPRCMRHRAMASCSRKEKRRPCAQTVTGAIISERHRTLSLWCTR